MAIDFLLPVLNDDDGFGVEGWAQTRLDVEAIRARIKLDVSFMFDLLEKAGKLVGGVVSRTDERMNGNGYYAAEGWRQKKGCYGF